MKEIAFPDQSVQNARQFCFGDIIETEKRHGGNHIGNQHADAPRCNEAGQQSKMARPDGLHQFHKSRVSFADRPHDGINQLAEQTRRSHDIKRTGQHLFNLPGGFLRAISQVRILDHRVRRPQGKFVKHAGHINATVASNGGIVGESLFGDSILKGFSVQINEMYLSMSRQKFAQVQIVAITRSENA